MADAGVGWLSQDRAGLVCAYVLQVSDLTRFVAVYFLYVHKRAFVHRLKETVGSGQSTARPDSRRVERASVERRDAVYSELLRLSPLSDAHRSLLHARGFDDSEVRRNRYGSTPSDADYIVRALAPHDLGGVPGFYRDGQCWRMAYCASGYFVPARDESGRIQALSYRLERPRGGMKYCWLSSNPEAEDERGRRKYPLSTSSGAPAHFAYAHLLEDARELVITEGALKADVIAYLTQSPVVGVAGVSTFGADFSARLKRVAPRLRTAVIAYDQDLHTNPAVLAALERLTAQLETEGLRVRVRTWPGESKGYDDYLLSQLRARKVTAA